MGVPVVTLSGRTVMGRGGGSTLANLGLPELVAQSREQYVEIAVSLAGDRARLAKLRAGLRTRMQSSPLRAPKALARDIEAAYRGIWRSWCKENSEK
jgi:predicted O-linked N-acetylglucosamine transferase (SPINDLY family)